MEVTRVNDRSLMTGKGATFKSNIVGGDIGSMFMFFYDPKHKKTLPYYDTFPLIFMIEKYSDGFLGMNLHYLPLMARARLMDALYKLQEGDSIAASYGLLKGVSRYKYFEPTVKRYLSNHVRSRFLHIPSSDWDTALFLPTERFKKSSKRQVWNESQKRIKR